jgi:peptide deformylase
MSENIKEEELREHTAFIVPEDVKLDETILNEPMGVVTSGYMDARTDEERANEPTAVITTSTPEEVSSAEITPETVQFDLSMRIVPPHNKVSRPVTQEDMKRVMVEAYILRDLCFTPNGLYGTAFAMHHSQIENEDPLNFFVMNDGRVIINPAMTRHTNHPVDSVEGCMTYPEFNQKVVQRYQKIEVDFQTAEGTEEEPTLSDVMKSSLSGKDAKIFQHEMDHGTGKYIFGEDLANPELGYHYYNKRGIVNNKIPKGKILREVVNS